MTSATFGGKDHGFRWIYFRLKFKQFQRTVRYENQMGHAYRFKCVSAEHVTDEVRSCPWQYGNNQIETLLQMAERFLATIRRWIGAMIWVCLKIGYTSNYSHLVGIMISKTIGFGGTPFSDKPI